jgi:hypothetical protein
MIVKNLLLLSFFVFVTQSSFGQMVSDFENVPLSAGINNGSDQSGGYQGNGLFFSNYYDAQFAYWTGFSASDRTDTVTTGLPAQYNSFAGSAFSGSKFGVAYASSPIFVRNSNPTQQKKLVSFRFTNNTYAALSMRLGDPFSKKFGGTTGNDPDFFKLTVYNYFNGQKTDSASFFLADFRNPDNSQDYIQKQWKLAETGFNNPFDSLGFALSSSDNGTFGMNTPAYFCLDDITITEFSSVQSPLEKSLLLYPNPTREFLYFNSITVDGTFEIFKADGKRVLTGLLSESGNPIRVSNLEPGTYILKSSGGQHYRFSKL